MDSYVYHSSSWSLQPPLFKFHLERDKPVSNQDQNAQPSLYGQPSPLRLIWNWVIVFHHYSVFRTNVILFVHLTCGGAISTTGFLARLKSESQMQYKQFLVQINTFVRLHMSGFHNVWLSIHVSMMMMDRCQTTHNCCVWGCVGGNQSEYSCICWIIVIKSWY